MSPEKVLELLQIIELSSKSANYAHITNSANTALVEAQLVSGVEHHSSPPPPSAPTRPTMADTRR